MHRLGISRPEESRAHGRPSGAALRDLLARLTIQRDRRGHEPGPAGVLAFLADLRVPFRRWERTSRGMLFVKGLISQANIHGILRLSPTDSIWRYTPPSCSS